MKQSATSKNIAAINRNIQSIANIFGTESSQYNIATADLYKYDLYTNKSGVIQLRNSKANRAQHQSIRARRARNIKPYVLQRKKREAQKALDKYNKRARDHINTIQEFEQRQQELDALTDSIYEDARIVENMLNIEVDRHRMYVDSVYREKIGAMARQAEQYQYGKVPDEVIEQQREVYKNGVLQEYADGTYMINSETGEIMFKY